MSTICTCCGSKLGDLVALEGLHSCHADDKPSHDYEEVRPNGARIDHTP